MISEPSTRFVLPRRVRFKDGLLDFLFPIRINHSISTKIRLMVIIGIMISLRIILGLFSIKLAPTLSISIALVPMTVLGWHIGPILGMAVGLISNTLSWCMSGSVFFWLYAIQEPLEMILASVIGFIYTHRKSSSKLIIDFCLMQVVLFAFWFMTLFYLLTVSERIGSISTKIDNEVFKFLKYASIAFLIVFLCTLEFFLFYLYLKKSFKNLTLFIYSSIFSIMFSFIFSFILGSYSSVEYFRYINHGELSPKFREFGYIFYLFPRIIKETFRLPFLIMIFFFAQDSICIPGFSQLKANVCFYW